jgi:hypothetical protein
MYWPEIFLGPGNTAELQYSARKDPSCSESRYKSHMFLVHHLRNQACVLMQLKEFDQSASAFYRYWTNEK